MSQFNRALYRKVQEVIKAGTLFLSPDCEESYLPHESCESEAEQ